ncbi:MAG: DUF2207 domain-containing protein [Chitinophagaceae bacterium]|nr:DUF2207 domain-containing protein [Chitinophagaceae bacterium]
MLFRRIFIFFILFCAGRNYAQAQESFFIKNFQTSVEVKKNAELKITEVIQVHFLEPRHGIIRKIPFRYKLTGSQDSLSVTKPDWVYNGYRYTKIKNVSVTGFRSRVNHDANYVSVKIGSENKMVTGDQTYQISYVIDGAINFFPDHSELYLNLTGNQWNVNIQAAEFSIHFYAPLPDTSKWFVATGSFGSTTNNTASNWKDNQTLSGKLIVPLVPFEGITAGVSMPEGFLQKPDYSKQGMGWLLFPLAILIVMYLVWKKYGEDFPVTVTTQYYPPENISPSVAGYLIDGHLDKRDLTALVPYWGAGGYLKVKESLSKQFFGLVKNKEYEFIKLKDLPESAFAFEKTMFNGLFDNRNSVMLKDLKDSFYKTMNVAKKDLEAEIKFEHYYTTSSRTLATLIPVLGLFILIPSLIQLFSNYPLDFFKWLSFALSSVPIIVFGLLMSKKTVKGTELYEKLLGFKEFIKTVEKDRLQLFLKDDPNYFDKVLPFAIVFDVADTWKDKLKGLDIPPPAWYDGYYAGSNFNTMNFMNSLDNSMNAMSSTFYSAPSSSGSSGGSFGGGGFSGGGFGGGGGSSW